MYIEDEKLKKILVKAYEEGWYGSKDCAEEAAAKIIRDFKNENPEPKKATKKKLAKFKRSDAQRSLYPNLSRNPGSQMWTDPAAGVRWTDPTVSGQIYTSSTYVPNIYGSQIPHRSQGSHVNIGQTAGGHVGDIGETAGETAGGSE